MKQLFISQQASAVASWLAGFPSARHVVLDNLAQSLPDVETIVWLRLPKKSKPAEALAQVSALCGRVLVIVMSDEPNDDEGMEALMAGAAAYCNTHSAPVVLQAVAKVVSSGGLWVGESLMKRMLEASKKMGEMIQSHVNQGETNWWNKLTPREREVAQAIGRGLNNREIADRTDIAERTVKAHVTSILEKLDARDRLHVSLIVHNIAIR